MRIFVLGYMGTQKYEVAQKVASQLNLEGRISSEIDGKWKNMGGKLDESLKASEEVLNSAKNHPFEVFVIDDEIVRLDGRTLIRICMGHGEHDIRNKEYEVLSKLVKPDFEIGMAKDEVYPENLVVVCGDGILLDEMNFDMLKKETCLIIDDDVEELWQRAKDVKTWPYAYMQFGSDEERHAKFVENYNARKYLYEML